MVPSELTYVVIGSIFTIFGSFSIQFYRDARRRRNTRQALLGEIQGARDTIVYFDNLEEGELHPMTGLDIKFSSEMYRQHLSHLGRLPSEEVERAIEYYQSVETLVDDFKKFRELREIKEDEKDELTMKQNAEFSVLKLGVKENISTAKEAGDYLIPRLQARSGWKWLIPF